MKIFKQKNEVGFKTKPRHQIKLKFGKKKETELSKKMKFSFWQSSKNLFQSKKLKKSFIHVAYIVHVLDGVDLIQTAGCINLGSNPHGLDCYKPPLGSYQQLTLHWG